MQNNYETYSADEFLEDAFFIEWVRNPTPVAEQFWADWVRNAPANIDAMREAEVELRSILSAQRIKPASGDAVRVWEQIQQTLQHEPGKVYKLRPQLKPLYKWMAAAAVLLFLVGGLWFIVGRDNAEKPLVVMPKVEDIAPGGDKAILTLADGRQVILDSANNGAITRQGSVTVIKLNGQLAYNKEGHAATEVLYNTITTPRGGQYQLVLADESKVWLNAESSLHFPTAFAGKVRKVELTGEGYFEVAPNAAMPFIVQRGEAEVKVLGTHFNINGYEDEPSLKITLLEGKVMVSSRDQTAVLKPGQQAQLQTTNSKLQIANQVDIDEVMAWKNGLFQFEQADIKTIMRQVARWYNVDVVFEGRVPDKKFDGKIYRNTSLKEVFDILEEGGGVHLKVSGKKVIVSL